MLSIKHVVFNNLVKGGFFSQLFVVFDFSLVLINYSCLDPVTFVYLPLRVFKQLDGDGQNAWELWTLKFYWKRENDVIVMCWRGVGVPSAGQTIRWPHCEMIPCLFVLLFIKKFFQLILNNTYQFIIIIIIIHLCYIKVVYVQLHLTQTQHSDFRDVLKKISRKWDGRKHPPAEDELPIMFECT